MATAKAISRHLHKNAKRTVVRSVPLPVRGDLTVAYAISGAGVIRHLPALRIMLIAVVVIHILGSLSFSSEPIQPLQGIRSFRFIVFSAGSLLAGLLYLFGTLAR